MTDDSKSPRTPPASEAEFLAKYRAELAYPLPAVAVDLVILTVDDDQLRVLLVRRKEHPFMRWWCLPGGFVRVGDGFDNQGESVEEAAQREMAEETGLSAADVYLEQLYTFGEPYRDPRMRVISVAYYALVRPDLAPRVTEDADVSEVHWSPVDTVLDGILDLAFDHLDILKVALQRIRGKLDYAPLVFDLVPDQFTIPEIRRVHEIVKGESYDPSNFRRRFRRMLEDELVVELEQTRHTGARPAKTYSFTGARGDRW